MKKYLYTTVFALSIVYSCNNITKVQDATEKNSFGVSKEQLATAGELYTAKCGKCHDLPQTTDFTAQEWLPIMERMIPKAKLTEEQGKWMTAYVSLNAKK